MNLAELKDSIKTKTLPHFLIFVGTEYALINEYIHQIQIKFNLSKYSIASACSVLTPSKVMTLTREDRLYVSRYEKQIQTSEKSWTYLKNLANNYLIIVLTSIDKRSKFYRQFDQSIVEFVEQNVKMLQQIISRKVKLSEQLLSRLITGCGNNYGRCCLEVDKIKALASEEHCTDEEAYKKLLKYGVIYEDPTTQIQDFIQCVMTGDYKCYKLLQLLKRNNESSFVLIAWLYTNIRNQLIVQSVNKISTESTGLNYYALKECQNRLNYYSITELKNALQIIKRVEQGLKNGVYEDEWAMDYILINIL